MQRGSTQIHDYPRAISMASPTRASFFRRNSRSSSVDESRQNRLVNSISTSRLAMRAQTDDEQPKKGFRAFLQKMKPKSRKSSLDTTRKPAYPGDGSNTNSYSDLAPPPTMAYLVGRGHARNHSGSSSSVLTDSQSGGFRQPSNGFRSVSAPIDPASSSGSQSISPASSRFRRDSYASFSARRYSGMDSDPAVEVLSGRMRTSPETQASYPDRSSYPPPSLRISDRPSMSTSSVMVPSLETPPPINPVAYFMGLQTQSPRPIHSQLAAAAPIIVSQSPQPYDSPSSPNRFKSLPPLPIPDEPFAAKLYADQMGSQPYPLQIRGRKSHDPLGDRPRGEMNPRMAQSMYSTVSGTNRDDGKSRKRGLKALFGSSKGARLA